MKKILILLITVVMSVIAFSQDERPKSSVFSRENMFVGGNFGLSIGNFTLINLSPQVGFRLNEYFAVGAGINGIYSSFRNRFSDPSFDYKEVYGVVGANIFGRVSPIDNVILQLQPEMNYTWGRIEYADNRGNVQLQGQMVPSLIGGAGIALPAGGRGRMLMMLQYDILQHERSPYSNRPFFNIGYNVGL